MFEYEAVTGNCLSSTFSKILSIDNRCINSKKFNQISDHVSKCFSEPWMRNSYFSTDKPECVAKLTSPLCVKFLVDAKGPLGSVFFGK